MVYTKKQIDVLSDIVRALRDDNTTVRITTVNNPQPDMDVHKNDKEFLPKKEWESRGTSAYGWNQMFAESISLGDGISLRRLNTGKYVARTLKGDAEFTDADMNNGDFGAIWTSAIIKSQESTDKDASYESYSALLRNLKDKTLLDIAKGPATKKQDKFLKAKDKIKNLGVETTKHLDEYIAKKIINNNVNS